jgi:hypothetical protein
VIIVAALTGVLDTQGIIQHIWHGIAASASAVAIWAHAKSAGVDPVEDLTQRVRHPVRWTMRNPIVAAKRKLDRRSP